MRGRTQPEPAELEGGGLELEGDGGKRHTENAEVVPVDAVPPGRRDSDLAKEAPVESPRSTSARACSWPPWL